MTYGSKRVLDAAVGALRERYIANEWATRDFPIEVAQTVLDAVPDDIRKADGEWSHPAFDMTKRKSTMLGEWMSWEQTFPFLPTRRWVKRARTIANGHTVYQSSRRLVHTRFVRVRYGATRIFDEWFGLDVAVGPKRWPSVRLNLGNFEVSFAVIPKKEWRAK